VYGIVNAVDGVVNASERNLDGVGVTTNNIIIDN
jgi:hypothetical protein